MSIQSHVHQSKKYALFLLLCLCILGGVVYSKRNPHIPASSIAPPYYTYTADRGWKTYENTFFGITFEHPTSLPVEDIKEENRIIIPYQNGYIIDMKKYQTDDDIPTWWEKNKDTFLPYEIAKTTFNGRNAYKLTLNTLEAQVPMDQYLVVNNEGIVAIAYQTAYRKDLIPPNSTADYEHINEEYTTTIQPIVNRILASVTFSD